MEWVVNPEEYRYVLGDFVRSGINIKYEKVYIEDNSVFNAKTIYFPYITTRQYQVYMEWHCVTSENDSLLYDVYGVCNNDYFKNWEYFCKAFDINVNDKLLLHKEVESFCYAFIYDYNVQLFLVPPYSFDFEKEDIEFVETNIQRTHIYNIWDNYNNYNMNGSHPPFYPIYMSLDWFYFTSAKKIGIKTILKCLNNHSLINQNDLIKSFVIDSFSHMSKEEIINLFKSIRDRYAHNNKIRMDEWYIHTAALMDTILETEGIEHIGMKIRKLRSFCNNKGDVLWDIDENNVPHLKKVLSKYKKNAEKVYRALRDKDYIDEQTKLSDFKYYLTGELEESIQGKIYWKKDIVEMIDFLLCISDDKGEWTVASQIFVDREGKHPTKHTLKSIKSQYYSKHTDKFEQLLK